MSYVSKRAPYAAHLTSQAQFGAVDSVRIRSAAAADPSLPKKAAVITHALDRQIRDSYNAYVVFAEASSVARAVATNGALFEGRHLRIDRLAGAAAASNRPRSPRLAPQLAPHLAPTVAASALARSSSCNPPPCKHRSGGLPRVLRAALVAREGRGGP